MKFDSRLLDVAKAKKTKGRSSQNAVIYTRVSSKEQAENNNSLESQKRHCEEYANKRNLKVVEYFGGTFESAKSDERKEFKRMLDFVKQHKNISYILVYAYDRFSRTGASGAYISAQLKQRGIYVVSVTQHVDPNSASGTLHEEMLYAFSSFDNNLRRDRMINGFRDKLDEGYWPLPLPLGFTKKNPGVRAENHQIIVDDTGKLLRKAWRWKLKDGMQNKEIVERLRAAGVNISQTKLSKIFRNPFYCGLVVSRFLDGEVRDGKHEPMVSQKEFFAVLDLLKSKFEKGRHSSESEDQLPLRRFVKCSDCGGMYTGYLQKQKNIYYYRCRTKGCCKNRNQKEMHESFAKFIGGYEVNPAAEAHIRKVMTYMFLDQNKSLFEQQEAYRKELQKVEETIEQLEERLARAQVTLEVFEKYRGKFEQERRDALQKIEECSITGSNLEKCIEWTLAQSRNLRERWFSGLDSERVVLQNVIFPDGVTYDRQKGTFLTNRVNTLFSPIPEIVRHSERQKRKSKGNVPFDFPLRRGGDSNPRYPLPGTTV